MRILLQLLKLPKQKQEQALQLVRFSQQAFSAARSSCLLAYVQKVWRLVLQERKREAALLVAQRKQTLEQQEYSQELPRW